MIEYKNYNINNKNFLILFPIILSFVISFFYLFSRLGLPDNNNLYVFEVLGLSNLIILSPFIINKFKNLNRTNTNTNYYFNDYIILCLGPVSIIFLSLILSYLNLLFPSQLNLILPISGFLFLIIFLKDNYSLFLNIRTISIIIFIILPFGIWLSTILYNSKIQSPFFIENIYLGNNVSADTLYHSSIASMIKTYNRSSTGLNGLPYLHYHYGSHYIFAQFSLLLNMNSLDFYNLGYQIIFIPLFFYYFLLAIINFKTFLKRENDINLRYDGLFWLIISLSFISFIPVTVSSKISDIFRWKSIIWSESYLLSLTWIFIGLSIFLNIIF